MTAVPQLRLRLVSWWWDYLLIVAWLAVVFVLIGIPQLIGWWDLSGVWANQPSTEMAITILTVVPYLLYLVLSEGRAPYATWGKRTAGRGHKPVRRISGTRPQLHQESGQSPSLATGPHGRRLARATEPTAIAMSLQVVSIVLLAVIVGPVLFGRPGLHDLLAGPRVASVEPRRHD